MISPAAVAKLTSGRRVFPRDILQDVDQVLSGAARGKGPRPRFMTAYQILDRLDSPLRRQLVQQYGPPGLGARNYYGAATAVAKAATMLSQRGRVRVEYIDTTGLETKTRRGTMVKPSFSVCGIYQII